MSNPEEIDRFDYLANLARIERGSPAASPQALLGQRLSRYTAGCRLVRRTGIRQSISLRDLDFPIATRLPACWADSRPLSMPTRKATNGSRVFVRGEVRWVRSYTSEI